MRLVVNLYFLFTIVATSCTEQKNYCTDYKNGKFQYFSKINKTNGFIERSDSIQLEIENSDSTLMKIIWTDPCKYELLFISSTKVYSTIAKEIRQKPLQVKILKANNSYYVFEAWKDGIDMRYHDTIWKRRE